ncbi:MAG: ORF6N domain-containing protein [Treponema sp.]|nr:ORF6N domain-containing protein [Treponema sp.]
MEENNVIPVQNMIYEIRNQKVMLDSDLAGLYRVEVKVMNQAVKRNIIRFPSDFMFQLEQAEWDILRSQFVTAKENESNLKSQIATAKKFEKIRYLPYVFTEQGVSMLSSVIHSEQAIKVNIQIMRAFVQLRHYVLSQTSSNEQISELHKLLMLHIDHCDYKFTEHDKSINQIIKALNNLMEKPKPTGKIGFHPD